MGVASLLASSALAQTSDTPQPVVAHQERMELAACMDATTAQMKDKRATPERYQMVMEGACLDEEGAWLKAFEAWAKGMDQGYSAITEKTMRKLVAFAAQSRRENVSRYTFWYETSQK